jgi:hypothetical protein
MTDLKKHLKIVKQAAYNFAVEDLCSTAGGTYDSFLDMLIGETDDRHVLASYFYCMLQDEYKVYKAFETFGSFLWRVINDSDLQYLLERHVEDCFSLLSTTFLNFDFKQSSYIK